MHNTQSYEGLTGSDITKNNQYKPCTNKHCLSNPEYIIIY